MFEICFIITGFIIHVIMKVHTLGAYVQSLIFRITFIMYKEHRKHKFDIIWLISYFQK